MSTIVSEPFLDGWIVVTVPLSLLVLGRFRAGAGRKTLLKIEFE